MSNFFKIWFSGSLFVVSFLYLIINNSRNQNINVEDSVINTSGRLEAWSFFFDKFLNNPFFGIGAGNSSKFVRNSDIEFFITPHNEYLRFLLEGGLVCVFIIFIFTFRHFIMSLLRKFKSYYDVDYILLLMYLSVVVFSITDNTFSTFQFYIPFLIIINFFNTSKMLKSLNN